MEQTLPVTCQVTFNDPHQLHEFVLLVVPDEGYWIGGHFYFQIYITEEYNMAVILQLCLHFIIGLLMKRFLRSNIYS